MASKRGKEISSDDSKKKKCMCSYSADWEKEFPIQRANGNPQAFYCVPCKKSISCGHMGRGDVVRHCDPANKDSIHSKNVNAIKKTSKTAFMAFGESSKPTQSVIKAEVLHTNFIVQHNLPLAIADRLTKVCIKLMVSNIYLVCVFVYENIAIVHYHFGF